MGVYGLWDIVAPAGRRVSPETLAGRKLVVDASIWLVQFLKALHHSDGRPMRNAHLVGFFWRLCRLLFYRIKPIVVFDGPPPELKRRTIFQRRLRRDKGETNIRKAAQLMLINAYKQRLLDTSKRGTALLGLNHTSSPSDISKQTRDEQATYTSAKHMKTPLEATTPVKEFAGGREEGEIADLGGASVLSEEINEVEDDDTALFDDDAALFEDDAALLDDDDLGEMNDRRQRRHDYYNSIPEEFRGFLSERRRLDDISIPDSILKMPLAANAKLSRSKTGQGSSSSSSRNLIPESVFREAEDFKEYRVSGSHGTEVVQLPLDAEIDPQVFQTLPSKLQYQILTQLRDAWFTDSRIKAVQATEDLSVFSNVQIESYIRGIRTNQEISKVKATMAAELAQQEKELLVQRGANQNQVYICGAIDADGCGPSSGPSYVMMKDSRETASSSNSNNVAEDPLWARSKNIHATATPRRWYETNKGDGSKRRKKMMNQMNFEPFQRLASASALPSELYENWKQSGITPVATNTNAFAGNVRDLHDSMQITDSELLRLRDDELFGEDLLRPIHVSYEYNTLGDEADAKKNVEQLPIHLLDGSKSAHPQKAERRDVVDLAEDDIEDLETVEDEFNDCETVEAGAAVKPEEGTEPFETQVKWEAQVEPHPIEETKESESYKKLILKKGAEIPLQEYQDTKGELKKLKAGPMCVKDAADMKNTVGASGQQAEEHNENVKWLTTLGDTKEEEELIETNDSNGEPGTVHTLADTIESVQDDALTEDNKGSNPVALEEEYDDQVVQSKQTDEPSEWEDIDAAYDREIKKINLYETVETPRWSESSVDDNFIAENSKKGVRQTSSSSIVNYSSDLDLQRLKDIAHNFGYSEEWEDSRAQLEEESAMLQGEISKLQRSAEYVTEEMQDEVRELLRAFGIPFVNAPAEAEAQCAVLNRLGLCDGVISDDSDALAFGSIQVFRNFFESHKTVELYELDSIERKLGLSNLDMLMLAQLLGCDYTVGVHGVGAVNALETIKAFPSFDDLKAFRKWAESPWMGVNEEQDSFFQKIYKEAHKKYRLHWEFPDDFPSESVLRAFTHPVVDASTERFSWRKPDVEGIKQMLTTKTPLTESQVEESLAPVMNRLVDPVAGKVQTRIDQIFSYLPANKEDPVATIKSKRMLKALETFKNRENAASDKRKLTPTSSTRASGTRNNKKKVNPSGSSSKRATGLTPSRRQSQSSNYEEESYLTQSFKRSSEGERHSFESPSNAKAPSDGADEPPMHDGSTGQPVDFEALHDLEQLDLAEVSERLQR